MQVKEYDTFVDNCSVIIDLLDDMMDWVEDRVFDEISAECYPIPALTSYLGGDVDIAGLEFEQYLQYLYEYTTVVADDYINYYAYETPHRDTQTVLYHYNIVLGLWNGYKSYDIKTYNCTYYPHIKYVCEDNRYLIGECDIDTEYPF